jgi:hypothetical protein
LLDNYPVHLAEPHDIDEDIDEEGYEYVPKSFGVKLVGSE